MKSWKRPKRFANRQMIPDPNSNPTNPYQAPGEIPMKPLEVKSNRFGTRTGVAIAWVIILCLTAFMFGTQFLPEPGKDVTSKLVETQNANMVGKMCVGIANMPGGTVEQALDQSNVLNSGPLENRYCYVLLQNEFSGATKALDRLKKVDELQSKLNYQSTASQKRLRKLIEKLLLDYEAEDWKASSLSNQDKAFLRDSLGYVGNLSLLPSQGDTASERDKLVQKSVVLTIVLLVGVFLGLGTMLLGFILFGMMIIMTYVGWIRPQFFSDSTRGRIYAETFAVWFVCFLAIQLAIGLGIGLSGIKLGARLSAGIGLFAFFGSLVALVWPGFRGVTFRELCADIGWTCKNPIKEMFCGLIAYIANLPIMAIGFACFAGLNAMDESIEQKNELEPVEQVSHPIMEQIASGDVLLIVLVALTACVAAPIVEETVFRGILYRHLREASLKWARILSVLFSTLVNSVIFAAIHPQGWKAVPVLAALAIGFSWAREWRGSLIAPMTMHAINNAIVTSLIVMTLI